MLARSTTPTIRYTFRRINVTDIVKCVLTIVQKNLTISHDLSEATVGENDLSWTLTQEETLSLDESLPIEIQIKYKTADGLVNVSRVSNVKSYKTLNEDIL